MTRKIVARTSSVPAPASFLVKLRDLLSKEDVQIISWDAEGQITIGDPTALTDLILKNYFRHSNFSSFQRQLNYFGYYKVSGKGRFERCVYKNKAFVVDDETGVGLPLTLDALLRLRRKSSCHGDDGDDAPRAASRRRSGLAKRASRRVVELQEARRRTRARASSITTVEASSSGDEEDDEDREYDGAVATYGDGAAYSDGTTTYSDGGIFDGAAFEAKLEAAGLQRASPSPPPLAPRRVASFDADVDALNSFFQHPTPAYPAGYAPAGYTPGYAPAGYAPAGYVPLGHAPAYAPYAPASPAHAAAKQLSRDPPGLLALPTLSRGGSSDEFLARAAIVSSRFHSCCDTLLREPLLEEQLWANPGDSWDAVWRAQCTVIAPTIGC